MPKKEKKKIKVLVAMSGGVDSSVAAALLVRAGYDVTGVFMKQWSDNGETTPGAAASPLLRKEGIVKPVCPWKMDRRDALRVAAHLGIPLLTLDFEKEYRARIFSYMIREYKKGRTPNPDVLCNREIKFGVWLDEARRRGFDYLATGHYARVGVKEQGALSNEQNDGHKMFLVPCFLFLSKDANKDQTYFLHQLSQEQLRHTMFPIGHLRKSEVRRLARKFKLPTADRAESMGICFVGEVPMREFLRDTIKTKIGKIVMSDGTVVGEHEGLPLYTIGQRHNLGNFRFQNSDFRLDSRPMFVVDKRVRTNELVVGYENDPLLWKKEIIVEEVNWVRGQEPKFPLKCEVRMRHRQTMQSAECRMQNGRVILCFKKNQKAVTPGQFAVFYKNGECLGGGVIA